MAEYTRTTEAARGCGYRKPGVTGVGIYLVGPGTSAPCGRLPFPLHSCPCCGGGIRPARSWTWIEPATLFAPSQEPRCSMPAADCGKCPLGGALPEGPHGLVWIGEKFYETTHDFMREASMMGVSRKIAAVPRYFVLGESFVYLAHRKAVPIYDPDNPRMEPGVFTVFKPTGIDLVVDDLNDVPERAERLAARIEKDSVADGAVRIVQVTPEHQAELPQEEEAHANN